MKRFLILFVIVFSLIGRVSAQWRLGVDAGMNLSHLTFSKSVVDSENRLGFFVGPKLHWKLPKLGIGVDGALRYAQRTSAIESWDAAGVSVIDRQKMHFVEVPLNARWDINPLKVLGFFIATGPQWDWYIGPDTWESVDHFKTTFNHHTLSWNVGLGLILFKQLHIGVTHNFPITKQGTLFSQAYDAVSAAAQGVEIKNHTWQFYIDFYFKK